MCSLRPRMPLVGSLSRHSAPSGHADWSLDRIIPVCVDRWAGSKRKAARGRDETTRGSGPPRRRRAPARTTACRHEVREHSRAESSEARGRASPSHVCGTRPVSVRGEPPLAFEDVRGHAYRTREAGSVPEADGPNVAPADHPPAQQAVPVWYRPGRAPAQRTPTIDSKLDAESWLTNGRRWLATDIDP